MTQCKGFIQLTLLSFCTFCQQEQLQLTVQ